MYKHGQGINRNLDRRGLIAEFLLKYIKFFRFHGTAHRAQLRRAFDESRWGRGRTFAFDLDINVRIQGAEALSPQGHGVVESVGADTVKIT